ncbi:MAG: hypothetical protein HQL05_01660 [Nitrospirae bacterium]|uniref:hypothetical protein n=1 Tax=Candidatus Magnetobacterium casense TaxID=1455061 RepID=UPI0012DD013D|nr:hypothetical protein [Candidatus Magnetobacterium casensis]MBF0336516.1 hypothetical protein [Nitrospirota bacterium]
MFMIRTVLLTVVLLLSHALALVEVQETNVIPTGVESHESEPRPEVRLIKNLRIALSCK